MYNQKPHTMQEARDLARRQESFLNILDKRYKSASNYQKNNYNRGVSSIGNKEGANLESNHVSNTNEGFRRLTLAELTEKKLKGLCYHCEKKYEPGHDCKKKKLYVMLGEDKQVSEEDGEGVEIVWEGVEAEKEENQVEEAKVSVQAMNGSGGTGTLKLQGAIQGKPVTILVDSGSTHNFISQNLVKQLHLKVSPCTPFKVTVANGDELNCETTVEPVSLTMSSEDFVADMHVIPLGGYDVILGIQWMSKVGPITFDYPNGNIAICYKNRRICLKQSNQTAAVQVQLSGNSSRFHKEEAYFLIQVAAVEGKP